MQNNPYIKTNWRDHIVDIETGQVIQEGTRFTATRVNNMEEGIYNSYESLKDYYDEITKLRIQLEMLGRAPTNNGTFFDPIDGEGNAKALKLLKEFEVSQQPLEIWTTEIEVDDSSVFVVGQYITIFDDENVEDKKIDMITGNSLTISPLTKVFKRGAYIVRSSALIKNNTLFYRQWGTYSVSIQEVI